jgi:hypothetical protein
MGLISIIAIVVVIINCIKEKRTPIYPSGVHYDWDAYWEDKNNGMTFEQRMRKEKRGGYLTTKPKYIPKIDEVVDVERYEYDKERYGKAHAEYRRKGGQYRYKIPFDRER